jgi:hypothetical protein
VPVNPTSNTTYTVEGTDQNGCKGIASTLLKVSTCAGLNERNTGQDVYLSIYPNPNNGKFTIKGDADADLRLINELGQLIKTISLNAHNGREVQLSDLPKGIYFISDNREGSPATTKIIVTE